MNITIIGSIIGFLLACIIMTVSHIIYVKDTTKKVQKLEEEIKNENKKLTKVELTPKQYQEFMSKGIIKLDQFDVPIINKEILNGKKL
jgi:hypothetical protein